MVAPKLSLKVSVAVLIVFSALMALVLDRGRTLFQPEPTRPDWKDAAWIAYPGGSDTLYLRRNVVLASAPKRAWLVVGAIDEFKVFVNGTQVGTQEYLGARPSAIYDLTRLLNVGSNSIAIYAKSATEGEPAQAIALLEWQTSGTHEWLGTDETWRAEARERRAGLGEIAWIEGRYPDADWLRANKVAPGKSHPLIRPTLPLDVVARGATGSWIWREDHLSNSAGFERVFRIDDSSVSAAWMGVSADGFFVISVNGIVIGPISGTDRRMRVFDIAPYLLRGQNQISIQVAGNTRPVKVGISGNIRTPDGSLDFSSDELWHTAPDAEPVAVLGQLADETPAITVAEPVPVRNLWTRQWRRRTTYFFTTLGLVLSVAWGVCGILSDRGMKWRLALALYAQPFALSTALLILFQLIDWDPRWSLEWAYPLIIPSMVLILVGVWLTALITGRYLKAPQLVPALQEPSA